MKGKNKVFIGADHAGYALKQYLKDQLVRSFPENEFVDCGCDNEDTVDYPRFSKKVAQKVVESGGKGILVCGSGIGMCIVANKFKGVRAAAAWDQTSAKLSREHNDTNVLCLGSRLISKDTALQIASTWLSTSFEAGRHRRRLDMIQKIEEET